jgi:hypothetical protein
MGSSWAELATCGQPEIGMEEHLHPLGATRCGAIAIGLSRRRSTGCRQEEHPSRVPGLRVLPDELQLALDADPVRHQHADDLGEVGGRLYLSGVSEAFGAQLRRAGRLALEEVVHLVPAADVLGESTARTVAAARAWLDRTRGALDR